MKLVSVKINEYKSIRDSSEFAIDDITCLVGKNESGKTAILQALYKLNPIIPEQDKFEVTVEYPRSEVEDYRQDIENNFRDHATVVEAKFKLDDGTLSKIRSDFGSDALHNEYVTLSKGYSNVLCISMNLNERESIKYLLHKYHLNDKGIIDISQLGSFKDTLDALTTYSQYCEIEVNKARSEASGINDQSARAKALAEADTKAEIKESKDLRELLNNIIKRSYTIYIWEKYIVFNLPKFLYFDEYYQMKGHVNINALVERLHKNTLDDSDRPMLGLLDLARIKIDQIMSIKNTEELNSKLEGASNYLSRQILKYWSQNKHLQLRFDIRPAMSEDPVDMRNGVNLWGRVYDQVHSVSTPLGTRSRGFVWFFSFLAWFSKQKKENKNIILLLDEPGLFLHAKAQSDLLRYMDEELKPSHQVIYTTHSPFMIDSNRFDRVRIVEDKSMDREEGQVVKEEGTKVSSDVLEVSKGSIFPLQGALGYEIAQTLFVGKNSLVVEGPSDLLYLQTMSMILQEKGREFLDERWTITPVGGADKIPTFLALLGSQKGLKVVTLMDFQLRNKQQIENICKSSILKKSNLFVFTDFVNKIEADIEDLFDFNFYLDLFIEEYKVHRKKLVAIQESESSKIRNIKGIEKYIRENGLEEIKFNHYRPARYFTENSSRLIGKISEDTFARFENLFKKINSIL